MHDQGLALREGVMQPGHRLVEAEEAIERQRRLQSGGADGQLAADGGVVGIADGGHGRQSVHGAAQDDDDETWIARSGR